MEEVNAKLDGLKELFNERFGENTKEHSTIWEQVKTTNGRVRLLEKITWAFGGALAILSALFSPQAVGAIINMIK